MSIESRYGTSLKHGSYEFYIDEDGNVSCNGDIELGHLESCLDLGELIAKLFTATADIDLSDGSIQQPIF